VNCVLVVCTVQPSPRRVYEGRDETECEGLYHRPLQLGLAALDNAEYCRLHPLVRTCEAWVGITRPYIWH
jgi:hypothetical protein